MSPGLFDEAPAPTSDEIPANAPLAERMRPRQADALLGQEHLLGRGRILEAALRDGLRQSLILWGPPGSGKTTLAKLLAKSSMLRFVPFSAVLSGIKEIKAVMAEAARERRRSGQPTLLFVDEIHRFNRAQQDAFLPHVESGNILLIGATTENPSFEVVGPLLSRARVVILQPLGEADLVQLLRTAIEDPERGLGGCIQAEDAALGQIARASDGDARRSLTLLETAAGLLGDGGKLTDQVLREALQRKILRHDKSGEAHYDLISALHKSVRNGDDTAALYWLARLLEGGEDRKFVARRLARMAVEDIGLADPAALGVALAAWQTWERMGSPEGELALAHVTTYLARAPKSNQVYRAWGQAVADVRERGAEPVPLHLRNAPTGLMKTAGYGEGYRSIHDDPVAADEMTCMPEGLLDRKYFSHGD